MPSREPKQYATADGRPLWGAAKRSRANAKPKAPLPGKVCLCGCLGMTKGGDFMMGHDARHKSNLIREVLAGGNADAEAELDRRGWTKFLDKKRELTQKAREPRTWTPPDPESEQVAQRLKLTADLKRAHWLLCEIQRAPKAAAAKAGKEWIETRYDNYEAILTGDLVQLTDAEQQDVWRLQGLDARAKVV